MKIKGVNFSFSEISIIIGNTLVLISFFMPWFEIQSNTVNSTAFSPVIWVNGYALLFLVWLNYFVLFSQNIKQKIKLYLHNSIQDSHIFILSGTLISLSVINSYVILQWLVIFVSDIAHHEWGKIALIGWIIIFFASIKHYKNMHSKTASLNIYDIDSNLDTQKGESRDKTTKLPF